MRISDWSSDVCSSDLRAAGTAVARGGRSGRGAARDAVRALPSGTAGLLAGDAQGDAATAEGRGLPRLDPRRGEAGVQGGARRRTPHPPKTSRDAAFSAASTSAIETGRTRAVSAVTPGAG